MSGIIKLDYSSVDSQSLPPFIPGRLLGNDRMSPTSPLKIFGQAKKKINDIFIEISSYIDEGAEFVNEMNNYENLIENELCEQFIKYKEKVAGIREILKRDRMKVAFFGRTSNGKSSVINAMLRNRILPSGIGHTTNCFLQVEGTEGTEAYLINETDPQQKMSLQSISQLASALSKARLNNDTLIRICWPKDLCNLLRDDVVLVDSPGVDVSPDLDTWIDKFCLDADVFVLVANAESTLMQTEKNFFHRVSERLSKPNIFILNNRWDASVSEQETVKEVKQQHLERNIEFLADELKVVSHHEAENRVFFVSARETLISRVNQDKGTPTPTGQLLEGFQSRLFEFANFERKFEECISQSAVETKFALHAENGKELAKVMCKTMSNICEVAANQRMIKEQEYKNKLNSLHNTDQQMSNLTADIQEQISRMTEDVEVKVSTALMEEIKRLSSLVDEYDRPFHPDPVMVNVYKKELHAYVEKGLSTNLESRCSDALKSAVDNTTKDMAERLLALVPMASRDNSSYSLDELGRQYSINGGRSHFEMAYRLDCRNLCADFREDIDFRFSLGISTLIRRFTGVRNRRNLMIQRPLSLNNPQGSPAIMNSRNDQDESDALFASLLNSFSSLYSGSTIGVIVIAAILAKAAGWKVIGLCGSLYAGLYMYERLSWTTAARERSFKRQYVDYASSKLKLIVDLTSSNCSHQVKQELNSSFSRLCQLVDASKSNIKGEITKLESDMIKLDEASKLANCLKNKTKFVDSEINNFILQFLKPDSKI